MTKTFFPPYDTINDYEHGKYIHPFHEDIIKAFRKYCEINEFDIRFKVLDNSWYVTVKSYVVSKDHNTRETAIFWLLQNYKHLPKL